MKAKIGLKRRLLIYLSISLPIILLVSLFLTSILFYQEMGRTSDSQIQQIAGRLLDIADHYDTSSKHQIKHLVREQAEEHPIIFTIWDKQGEIVLSGKQRWILPYAKDKQGFYDFDFNDVKDRKHQNDRQYISTQKQNNATWRAYYSENSQYLIAVAKLQPSIKKIIIRIIKIQIFPFLISVPLILLVLWLSITHGLKPLLKLSQEIQQRSADDGSPILNEVPAEIQPVVHSLNTLFQRIAEAIEKEQRFTADAAHELRSPLAALKIQIDVLALSSQEEQTRILANIRQGIDRATHLIDQLLILSKLDPMTLNEKTGPISWQAVSDRVLQEVNLKAREKQIQLKRVVLVDTFAQVLPLRGDAILIELMLRNIVDNAVRYAEESGTVELILSADSIQIIDDGPGVSESILNKITERFYRPAGQKETGSGLGLSIVTQIANIHGLKVNIYNRDTHGLCVEISHVSVVK